MADAVETFIVDKTTYTIEADFTVRRSGCKIFRGDDITDARKMLHHYARNQLLAEIGNYNEMVARAQRALDRLGSDPFHLARFL